MDALRLFIAFDTPPPVKSRIRELTETLRGVRADVHWEPPEKLHCTMKFLGSTSPDLLGAITETLDAIARRHLPLSLVYEDIGFFPNPRAARVVWVGIFETDGRLQNLHGEIDAGLGLLGFAPDSNAFHPHVTLGRIRSARNLRQLIATAETLTFSTALYRIESFSLLRSDLRPSGSVYTQEKSFPLVGNP